MKLLNNIYFLTKYIQDKWIPKYFQKKIIQMPPPKLDKIEKLDKIKLEVNPFTGEKLDDDDNKSMASYMSSRSTASRLGRDGDEQVKNSKDK